MTDELDLDVVVSRLTLRPVGATHLRTLTRVMLASRKGVVGVVLLSTFGIASALAPLVASQDPSSATALSAHILAGPTWSHPLGTDENGKDVLSELLYGGRLSMSVGLIAAAIATTIG